MKKSAWADSWSSVSLIPFSSQKQQQQHHARGASILCLLLNVSFNEQYIKFLVRLEHDVTLGDIRLEKGNELEISLWTTAKEGEQQHVDAMDRVHLTDCIPSPSKKEPGKMYYNCRAVRLEQDWIQVCADDAYLAQQSVAAPNKFILTSRETFSETFCSSIVWPDDVSMIKKDGTEIPVLTFRGKFMRKDDSQPTTFEFKLWAKHCETLVPGLSSDIPAWKAVIRRNTIPFAVVCSVDMTGKFAPIGGAKLLTVHAIRADTRGYLLSSSCPPVSRALVKQHVQPVKSKDQEAADIVNVSAVGLSKAGAFPVFRAMTSNPDELTSEEAIAQALAADPVEETVVFFGMNEGESAKKKQRK